MQVLSNLSKHSLGNKFLNRLSNSKLHLGQSGHKFVKFKDGLEAIEFVENGETYLVFGNGGVERASDIRYTYTDCVGLGKDPLAARHTASDWLNRG